MISDAEYAELERVASGPADEILESIIDALGAWDDATLRAVIAYRDEIRPGGWFQQMIREYMEMWR